MTPSMERTAVITFSALARLADACRKTCLNGTGKRKLSTWLTPLKAAGLESAWVTYLRNP